MDTKLKLSIELVPSSSWYSNVRSNVTQKEWKIIQNHVFAKANFKCEICGGIGKKHPVECHEVWEYNDITKTQTLTKCIALCPQCHSVKHIGFALIQGKFNIAKKWFCYVNSCDENIANEYIKKVFDIHENRSNFEWFLDINWIQQILKKQI